ncbi:MAG: hypothetical protein GC206_16460 [Alphaproteobacteria bacterium]|nr:hypothetical protein [Alphaproteobacteria bacterium]
MADGSAFRPVDAEYKQPPLVWRRPAWLWASLAFAIGVVWPLFFLSRDGGLAQLAAISVGAALLLAFGVIAIGDKIRRPPTLRRHIVIIVLACTGVVALFAPFVFVGLLGLLAGIESSLDEPGLKIAGLSQSMAWALAPIAFLVGAPSAIAAALTLSILGFRREKPGAPGVLIARRAPELTHDKSARLTRS